jgi:hypothetical protein
MKALWPGGNFLRLFTKKCNLFLDSLLNVVSLMFKRLFGIVLLSGSELKCDCILMRTEIPNQWSPSPKPIEARLDRELLNRRFAFWQLWDCQTSYHEISPPLYCFSY